MSTTTAMADGFVESRGIKIHYLANPDQNRDRLTIVFVPGVMMPSWIWEPQLRHFSKSYNVIAMDPRSQGKSDHSAEGHFAASRAEDIKAVIEHFDCRKLVLVGWSIAVPEVINYAIRFASKELVGLVLVDGIAGADSNCPFYQGMLQYWTGFQTDRQAKGKEFIKILFTQPHEEAYLDKLERVALATPTNTVMTLMFNYMLEDFRPLLPQIKVPTWIATIEGPRLEYMKAMKAAIPHCGLDVIKGAGHAVFVDQPEEFNRRLEAFLQSVVEQTASQRS